LSAAKATFKVSFDIPEYTGRRPPASAQCVFSKRFPHAADEDPFYQASSPKSFALRRRRKAETTVFSRAVRTRRKA